MSGNNPYISGAGMGATENEALSLREQGEGIDYARRLASERQTSEEAAAKIAAVSVWRGFVQVMRPEGGFQYVPSEGTFETKSQAQSWAWKRETELRKTGVLAHACSPKAEPKPASPAVEIDGVMNLTQHPSTAEQVEAGVVEPAEKGAVQAALTFDAIPTASEMAERAAFLARIAVDSGCKKAMIGGAPFFMAPLERALLAAGITPVYAFSVRDSVEQPDGNGGVRKVNVFRHIGFVEAAQ
jgi:hypothetical protein